MKLVHFLDKMAATLKKKRKKTIKMLMGSLSNKKI